MDVVEEDDIERFISETNCSPETARFYLEMTNGNYAQALEQFHEMGIYSYYSIQPN